MMNKITAYIDGKELGEVVEFTLPVFGELQMKDICMGKIIPPNFDNDVVIDEERVEKLRKAGVMVIDSEYIEYDIEAYRHPNCEKYIRQSSELKRKLTESRDRVIAEMIKTRVAIGGLPILNFDYPQYWRY